MSSIYRRNLRRLPRFSDSISYAYLERGRIEQTRLGVEFRDVEGRILIPIAGINVIILGPGISITHAAVQTIARNNTMILWMGEEGVRFYAHGQGGTRRATMLERQAYLSSHPEERLKVVWRMYAMRFQEPLPEDMTLDQVRGKEGARVRAAYARAAEQYGVEWKGRNYDRQQWGHSDPVNRALSAANACLYGLVHGAIISAGYSPGLGFIHRGTQQAFVYDIADLYKTDISIPAAFEAAALGEEKLESRVRMLMRQRIYTSRLLKRIHPDIECALAIDRSLESFEQELDEDLALPAPWWTPDDER